MKPSDKFTAIEDYYLVGDLHTAALVSKDGSIDWLCMPNFDSPSIFGRLLDPTAGYFSLDMPSHKITMSYIENTAIVRTELSKGKTRTTIKDFMVPIASKRQTSQLLVRQVYANLGNTNVKFKFAPKPNYSKTKPRLRITTKGIIVATRGGSLFLHLPQNTTVKMVGAVVDIDIYLNQGDTAQLILEYLPKGVRSNPRASFLEEKTIKFWENWISRGEFFAFCRSKLVRSAITLKLLQFYPTGAIVAAPTTSLPEDIGGIRNWDYRYSWIRDATFTLYAFTVLGYKNEAERFFDFIERITEQCAAQDFDVSLMYTIWGEPIPKERVLKQFSGYKHSSPVRIGNNASEQFQLDVYGALIDAIYFVTKEDISTKSQVKRRKLVMNLVGKIDELWQKPGFGIWEARDGAKQYTYSRVMAWVGADRAWRLASYLGLSKKEAHSCQNLAGQIKEWIWQNCYDQTHQVLVQYPGATAQDATNFLFVLLKFLDKHSNTTRTIVDNTQKELGYKEIFVYRYLKDDGLSGSEGAFLLCSFWLVSALAILEDVKYALMLFKKIEKLVAPSGLISEEIDPKDKAYLGNFPQAFSHLGYIMASHYIHKYATKNGLLLE